MKKVLTLLTALVLVAAMAISASAAEFAPSVEQKPAPAVESATTDDGKTIVLATASLANATGETKDALKQASSDLKDKKVTDLVKADDLKKAAGDKVDVEKLVVKDLFDVSATTDVDGKVTFTVKTDLKAGTAFVVLHKTAAGWEVIPAANVKLDANGKLTITSENGLSPFAILVDASATSPKTGETVSMPAVAACASFAVLACAAFVMGKKKSA